MMSNTRDHSSSFFIRSFTVVYVFLLILGYALVVCRQILQNKIRVAVDLKIFLTERQS